MSLIGLIALLAGAIDTSAAKTELDEAEAALKELGFI